METANEVPADLRAIAAFLSLDENPTTIVTHLTRDEQNSERDWQVVYSNPAFQKLQDFARQLEDIRHALNRSLPIDQPLIALHGEVLHGGSWQARVSEDYCIVIAKARVEQVPAPVKDGISHTSKATDLDWIQSDRPDLSPWNKFFRGYDWASTSLGPMSSWSEVLRLYVLSMMSNPQPRLLVWGEDMALIYNEQVVPLLGAKHPSCLGQNVKHAFAESWSEIVPVVEAGYGGEVKSVNCFPLPILRHGFLEECYFGFTALPVVDRDGRSCGMLSELTESTTLVTAERRRYTMNQLGTQLNKLNDLAELWPVVLAQMNAAELDVPYAILYTVKTEVTESVASETTSMDSRAALPKHAQLVGTVGLSGDHPGVPDSFPLSDTKAEGRDIWQACNDAWSSGEMLVLSSENGTLPPELAIAVPNRGFGDQVKIATISPIKAMAGSEPLAILVWGLNPRSIFGGEYQVFRTVFIDILAKAAALIQLPHEQQRAQKIAEDVNHALAQQLRLTTLKAERSEARFKRLADVSPTGMFLFDASGLPLYANEQCLEMLKITEAEYLAIRDSDGLAERVHEEDVDEYREVWTTMTERKMPITAEFRLRPSLQVNKQDGTESDTWLSVTAFPEIESDGTVSSMQGWLTDISHRKFNEKLLAQRLEDALENKRQTENFMDMHSHEIRNPLSAILQSADSIETLLSSIELPLHDENMVVPTHVGEDIMDAVQTIILCAQHQKRIVDDILTLSKLDASLLVMSPDKVQVPSLVTKALKMYEAEIGRAGIDAQLCIEPTYDELDVNWVVLDSSRLLQVIINLLTNSIKFTQYSEERKIKICIGASYQKPTGKHHGISFIEPQQIRTSRSPVQEWPGGEDLYLQFAVYDTGRGLSEDEMKLLFQRFRQASPKTYKQYGGSGLGLYISRELCELQGGQIGVSCGNGKTVFTFFVKAKRWVPSEEEDIAALPVPVRYASASSSPVVYSKGGSTTLNDEADQLGTPREENGNMIENFHPRQQPFARQQSFGAANQMPVFYTSQVKARKDSTENGQKALHVLIVEDNLINQKVMSQQLRRAGCTVHVANHGIECLNFLESSTYCSSTTPLSVVLLDLEMPEMDGLTCIREIRRREAAGSIISHVPVIAVTANARSEQINNAIEAGMDQVVTKPFRIPELVPQMERLVAEVGG
ncbi:Transcription factor SKN7 [Cercospora beticola]|uniref:Transcription factor SKN7 n=1 Tax=Cercospora beticola TaxID=122368 RepID=A0A2G5HAV0_CERBT|nr:Transcription factor SKN7 [Cercospora beticola]PIA89674.1 Transcription factor SKN7 [Cercospora beticola]WPB03137.1 hypothetical protein RHO25_007774 [Cercospora beticola]